MDIKSFKTTTNKLFNKIDNYYGPEEIENIVSDEIAEILSENDITDCKILNIIVYGSRSRGKEKKDSDIDILVEYDGPYKEYSLFNLFNEYNIEIGGIPVDINPVKKGTLEWHLDNNETYLQDISPEKLVEKSQSEDPARTVKSKEITITYTGLNNRGDLLFKTFTPSSGKTWHQAIRLKWLKDYEKEYKEGDNVTDDELLEAITTDDVQVYCNDPSFKYMGWKAKAAKENYGITGGDKVYCNHSGSICKHLLKILENIPKLKKPILEDLKKQYFRSKGTGNKTAKVENEEKIK